MFSGSADDDLKCYHCTKEITLVNGKNKTTIHKFNNDTKVTECDEKTCTEVRNISLKIIIYIPETSINLN